VTESAQDDELRFAVAVDTGGTFTDVTLFDRHTGEMWTAKTPSTPDDPSHGFLNGVTQALSEARIEAPELTQVFHGTTVATNLILEGKGAASGLLTTAGFKHVLEIGRQDIPRRVNLFSWIKPTRPLEAHHIHEVPERLDAGGQIIESLDCEAVRSAARGLRDEGINAIAVCFLHGYANPEHERLARALINEEHPDALVSISSDVLPVVREYERCMATVLNVYTMPSVARYVERLEARLDAEGIGAPLLIMKSNGGVASALEIRRIPAYTALSGPAAGVVGAGFIGDSAGFGNVIGIDIGGTSADICLIKDGHADLTSGGQIGDWPLSLPMMDINTVGTGGGSIARVTATGALTVGPESAGAEPGPACYGRGGTEPTVSDAHLVLGRLPTTLLGGGMTLDVGAAAAAIERAIAGPLGLSLEQAAQGILDISNNDMVGAIRVVSIERGHDPKDFALIAFGGAGPLHGSDIARLLGMETVIIPPSPGVLSALGLLVTKLRTDYAQTCLETPPNYDLDRLATVYEGLEHEAGAWFEREGAPPQARVMTRSVSLRYRNQGFELEVPWQGKSVTDATIEATIDAFHELHSQLYTFAQHDTPVEIVTLRVSASCALEQPRLKRRVAGGSANDAFIGRQPVSFPGDGVQSVPVYDRSKLTSDVRITGPALFTQLDSTAIIMPDESARTDPLGNLIVNVT
jgi:N-methylhydantoinase A